MVSLIERVPPNDAEAEQVLMSTLLGYAPEDVKADILALQPGVFYQGAHRAILAAAKKAKSLREPVDMLTIQRHLGSALGDTIALDYLVDLVSAGSLTASVPHYLKRVRELAKRRELIAALSSSLEEAFTEDPDVNPVEEAQKRLVSLDLGERSESGWRRLGDVLQENYALMEAAKTSRENGQPVMVLETGFYDLDEAVMFCPGDMIVLAALTGFGKTSLALNIARNVAERGHLVAAFSLEMSALALTRRQVTVYTGAKAGAQMRGFLSEEQWKLAAEQIEKDYDLPLHISDKPSVTVSGMLAHVRRLEAMERRPVALVVVDYLQLADVDGKAENETTRASKVSRGLKLMAMELNCPLLALSQFNRGASEAEKPGLRHLKQSGSIEQDASVVMMLHRKGHKDGDEIKSGPVDVLIEKNRHGECGEVTLMFEAEETRFRDRTYEDKLRDEQ